MSAIKRDYRSVKDTHTHTQKTEYIFKIFVLECHLLNTTSILQHKI